MAKRKRWIHGEEARQIKRANVASWLVLFRAWRRGSLAGATAIEWSLAIAIGYPIAIVFLSLAGMHAVTGIVAIGAPIVGLLLLTNAGFRLYRLQLMGALEVAGVTALTSEHARRSLKRLLQWLALVLFVELSFGMYFTVIPVENARGRILWVVGAGMLLLLARALPAGKMRKSATMFLMTFLISTTLAFYPGARKAVHQMTTRAEAAQTIYTGNGRIVRVRLLGANRLSAPVNINSFPAGWNYRFEGPLGTWARFDDGTVGPITHDFGVKGGLVRFAGPAGGVVTVRTMPPGQ